MARPALRAAPGVDAHHHLWQLARGDYGWLTPSLAAIYRDFELDDLAPLLAGTGIGATVLVQAAPTMAETQFLLEEARRSRGLVAGVVGWADLAAPDAVATLSRLARDRLLKSVRPMLQDLEDAQWILRPEVARALAALPGLGLRFDALVKPRELPALLAMVDRHPRLEVVIDHGGKPPIATGAMAPWDGLIAALAHRPQVSCKLSGLVTEADAAWTTADLRPYVDHLLEHFGPSRLIWGSDWPVVNLAGGYRRWWSAAAELVASLSDAERAAITGDNARRFYGLAAGGSA
jgi:L-fuconolactonase